MILGLGIGSGRCDLVVLGAFLVEIQIDGGSVVEDEVVLAVGPRSNVDVHS